VSRHLSARFPRPPAPPRSPFSPYTTLFRSRVEVLGGHARSARRGVQGVAASGARRGRAGYPPRPTRSTRALERSHAETWQDEVRSEEHTSELQSRENLVCRLLLEKKKKKKN